MVKTNNLAQFRAAKGLSQEQLAKAVRLSPSTIAMYETYQRTPSLRSAKVIAGYFGASIEDVFAVPALTISDQAVAGEAYSRSTRKS